MEGVIKQMAKNQTTNKTSNSTKTVNKTTSKVDNKKKVNVDEIEKLKNEIELLKKMLIEKVSDTKSINNVTEVSDDNYEVLIGSNMLNDMELQSLNGDAKVTLKYKKEIPISASELKLILRKDSVRELLRNDIIYFINKEDYDKFKIKKNKDLSSENLIKILSQNSFNNMVSDFNNLTNDKKSSNILHSILYRICDMMLENKLNLSFQIIGSLEEYFGFSFKRGIESISEYKKLKM